MNFQHIALVSFAMVAACSGHIGGHVPVMYQDLSPQVYCGRSLARSLALLCYDEPMHEKRSEFGTMYSRNKLINYCTDFHTVFTMDRVVLKEDAILHPYYKERDQEMGNQKDWWIPLHKSRSLGLQSRNKRLVVSECCDKPCNINELMEYC